MDILALRQYVYAVAALNNSFLCNGMKMNINYAVKGFDVAIVGNGGSARKNVMLINKADSVVQFNRFPDSVTTGIRPPDVHFVNGHVRQCRANVTVMIECSFRAVPPSCAHNTVCVPSDDTRHMLCTGVDKYRDASRGFMALSLLRKDRNVTLHGFKGTSHYYENAPIHHNIDTEHAFLQQKFVLNDR